MSFIANVASKAGRICIRIETEVNLALSLDSRTVFSITLVIRVKIK